MRLRRHLPIRGQSLVEFALVLPVFFLLLFGVLDLGRGVLAFNSVSNSAREGARTAIVDQTVSAINARAIRTSTGAGLSSGDIRIAFRRSNDPTNTSNVCSPATVGCVAVVTVRTLFQAATPLIGNIVGPLCLQSTTMMAIEAVPIPAPAPPPAWTAACP